MPVLFGAQSGSPFIAAWNFTDSAGFGTRFSNPSALPTSPSDFRLSTTSKYLGFSSESSPYVSVLRWTASGFGTRYSDPGTLINTNAYTLSWAPGDWALCLGALNGSQRVATYRFYGDDWPYGFGGLYGSPWYIPSYPPRDMDFSPAGNAIAFTDNGGNVGARSANRFNQGGPSIVGDHYGQAPGSAPDYPSNIRYSPTGNDVVSNGSAWKWSSAGWGTRYSESPSRINSPTGKPSWKSDESVILTPGSNAGPYGIVLHAFRWSSTGWGAKYTDITQLAFPDTVGYSSTFSPSGNAVFVGHRYTPFVTSWQWTNAGGYGTKYSNPTSLATGSVYRLYFIPAVDATGSAGLATTTVTTGNFASASGSGLGYSTVPQISTSTLGAIGLGSAVFLAEFATLLAYPLTAFGSGGAGADGALTSVGFFETTAEAFGFSLASGELAVASVIGSAGDAAAGALSEAVLPELFVASSVGNVAADAAIDALVASVGLISFVGDASSIVEVVASLAQVLTETPTAFSTGEAFASGGSLDLTIEPQLATPEASAEALAQLIGLLSIFPEAFSTAEAYASAAFDQASIAPAEAQPSAGVLVTGVAASCVIDAHQADASGASLAVPPFAAAGIAASDATATGEALAEAPLEQAAVIPGEPLVSAGSLASTVLVDCAVFQPESQASGSSLALPAFDQVLAAATQASVTASASASGDSAAANLLAAVVSASAGVSIAGDLAQATILQAEAGAAGSSLAEASAPIIALEIMLGSAFGAVNRRRIKLLMTERLKYSCVVTEEVL